MTLLLLAVLTAGSFSTAVAAVRYRLSPVWLPATLVMSLGLLVLPALSPLIAQSAVLVLCCAFAGVVGLAAVVRAWRTRTSQLPLRWSHTLERAVEREVVASRARDE